MAEDREPQIATGLADKKKILIGCGAVVIFIIALVLIIIFFGSFAADPRGEQLGPDVRSPVSITASRLEDNSVSEFLRDH